MDSLTSSTLLWTDVGWNGNWSSDGSGYDGCCSYFDKNELLKWEGQLIEWELMFVIKDEIQSFGWF